MVLFMISVLHHFPLMVCLDRCNGSCNTLDNLSRRIGALDETKDVNLNVFNVVTGINK